MEVKKAIFLSVLAVSVLLVAVPANAWLGSWGFGLGLGLGCGFGMFGPFGIAPFGLCGFPVAVPVAVPVPVAEPVPVAAPVPAVVPAAVPACAPGYGFSGPIYDGLGTAFGSPVSDLGLGAGFNSPFGSW